ncbi:MAG: lipopolysaccharide biosynthesis protein [Candidatus Dormibacteraceae bacterium]
MSRLTKNVLYNVAGQGAVLVLTLVAVRFIFRRLGDDVFGIIFFNLVLTSLLTSALELGISATIVREVSRHYDSDRKYVRDLVRSASFLYWAGGVLLVAVIWISAPSVVTQWVNLKTINAGAATEILRILSVTALVALPRALYASLFRGRQMMGLTNAIDVGTALAQQAGILLLLVMGKSVYSVATWISASVILGILAYLGVTARFFGSTILVPSVSPYAIRRNLAFAGRMMTISLLSLIHIQTAQLLVSKLLPIVQFGFYGLASSTVSRAQFVTGAVAQAAFPSFSILVASDSRALLLSQYRKLQDLVCFGTLPLFAGICFAVVPAYSYVFNASAAHLLLLPTVFLALGTWMNATLNIPYMLSLAMGKPEIAARLNIYALLCVLPVTAALTYLFGLPGAGFSWVFYHLFAYAYMVPKICHECLQDDPSAWFLHVLKILGVAVVTYGPAWAVIMARNASSSVPMEILAYGAATFGFGFGSYILIGPELRQTIRRVLGAAVADTAPAV